MAMIGLLLMFVGWVVSAVGSIMVLIKAFQNSIVWGLCSLFIPFVIFVFVAQNWEETKKGFLISLLGFGIIVLGAIMGAVFGASTVTLEA